MTLPAEMYSMGSQVTIIVLIQGLVTLLVNFVFIPIFYNNHIDNCYAVKSSTKLTLRIELIKETTSQFKVLRDAVQQSSSNDCHVIFSHYIGFNATYCFVYPFNSILIG